MKKITILISLLFLNSRSDIKFEKKLKDLTIKDKTFIVETTNGENVSCHLLYESDIINENISDAKLREIIEIVNNNIIKDLIVPNALRSLLTSQKPNKL